MSAPDQPKSPSDAAPSSAAASDAVPASRGLGQAPATDAPSTAGSAVAGAPVEALRSTQPWQLWLELGADADAESAAAACAQLVLPSICVCCADPSSHVRGLALNPPSPAGASPRMLLPLCDRCYTHEAVERTRALSVAVAGLLLGISLALGLPLALERLAAGGARQLSVASWLSRYGIFMIPCGVMLGLMAVRWLTFAWTQHRRRRAFYDAGLVGCVVEPALSWWGELPGHAKPKSARKGLLLCRNPRFASALSEANPGCLRLAQDALALGRGPVVGSGGLPRPELRWLLAVLCLLGLISVGSFWIHRPQVQVLNLTGAPLVLEVDGERLATISPTSQESSRAGLTLRLPAGRRHLRALHAEALVAEADVTLLAGAKHLYAPASDGQCFWLERLGYGRGNLAPAAAASAARRDSAPAPPRVERVPLRSPVGFWAFDGAVDVWLAPPPEPLLEDARSSGGEVVALRQALCADAPADARPR